MLNIDAYNANLRATDAAKAIRRQQPSGLAGYQARKKAAEDAELAPYAIVKDGYEYCVTFEGKGSAANRYRTKREALEAARELKRRHDEHNQRQVTADAAETTRRPDNGQEGANTMNTQEILTRVIDAIQPYQAIEKARDSRDVNPWGVASDMHERLAALRADLEARVRMEIAGNAGRGNAAKTMRGFLKAVAKDPRESLHFPWIDGEGRECYCDGYRAFRLNTPLRLVDRPDNVGEPMDIGRIYPDSLEGWKEVPMPTIAEIKTHIALKKAGGEKLLWRFGPGKPTVNAKYLLDAAQVFPDAERLYWNRMYSPMVIQGRDGDGLILPVRMSDDVEPEPANQAERKAIEAYDAKVAANQEEQKRLARAVCEAHDMECAANDAMNQAAARCETLEAGVKNAQNENLRAGLMEQLAGARREYALAALKRHSARLVYDPTASMSIENLETLVKMLYGDHAA